MFQKNKKKFRKWFGKKRKEGLGGLFSKKRQHKKNQKHMKYNSTFDPKIHKMSPHGLGYQMKDNIETDPNESKGSVLSKMFDKWSASSDKTKSE
jgi:hypothetical protein